MAKLLLSTAPAVQPNLEGGFGSVSGGPRGVSWSPRPASQVSSPERGFSPSGTVLRHLAGEWVRWPDLDRAPSLDWAPIPPRYLDLPDMGGFEAAAPYGEQAAPSIVGPSPLDWSGAPDLGPWYGAHDLPHRSARELGGGVAVGAKEWLEKLLAPGVSEIDSVNGPRTMRQYRSLRNFRYFEWSLALKASSVGTIVRAQPVRVQPGKKGDADQKSGGAQWRRILRGINMTLGRVSEVRDFLQVLASSVWAKDGAGRLYRPYAVSHDIGQVLDGLVFGEYRLDLVGFAHDFAVNQGMDLLAAIDPQRLRRHAAVWQPVLDPFEGGVPRFSGSSVEWKEMKHGFLSRASRLFEEPLLQRSQRVRSLF